MNSPINHGWTGAEDTIIVTVYPSGGMNACADLLLNKSLESIRKRAKKLGVAKSYTIEAREEEKLAPVRAPESPLDAKRREIATAEIDYREIAKRVARVHREYAMLVRETRADRNHQRRVS